LAGVLFYFRLAFSHNIHPGLSGDAVTGFRMVARLTQLSDGETLMDIGPTELLIILVIVLLVFGVGRIAKVGGELGKGIREFRQGLTGEDPKDGLPKA